MRGQPATVWRLTIAYVLMMAGTPLMVLLAGIVGSGIAPDSRLATLPVALIVVGVAASTLPTGQLLQHLGRRKVFLGYAGIAVASALLAIKALVVSSFSLFCGAALLMGWAGAAGHQYRFAALEAVAPEQAPKATSVLLFGGVLSAFVGPELAVRGRTLLEVEYAGSFLLLICSYLAGALILAFYHDERSEMDRGQGGGRSLSTIFSPRRMRLALLAAVLGYAVMSFIMTATPIAMHVHGEHSLESTKFVIQSHIAGMYLPALIYPWLQSQLGYRGMLWLGLSCYLLCLGLAVVNSEFLSFWLALILLGVGWNFLFLSGTNLLPSGYRPEERFRVQSVNDFAVFSVQAIASLSAGWLLALIHWQGIIVLSLIPTLASAVLLVRWSVSLKGYK